MRMRRHSVLALVALTLVLVVWQSWFAVAWAGSRLQSSPLGEQHEPSLSVRVEADLTRTLVAGDAHWLWSAPELRVGGWHLWLPSGELVTEPRRTAVRWGGIEERYDSTCFASAATAR